MVTLDGLRLAAVLTAVVLALLGVLRRRRETRIAAAWRGAPVPSARLSVRGLLHAPLLAAVLAAVVAWRAPLAPPPQAASGTTPLVFAVDVSRSMEVDDARPSRAEAADAFLERTFRRADAPEAALVAFAADAALIAPLTRDAGALVRALDELPRLRRALPGGSSLTAAIDRALVALPPGRSGAIVLVSDGEDTGSDLDAALERAVERGVTVHALGVGTTAGRSMAVARRDDDSGPRRVTRLDEARLRAIATRTGGRYLTLDPDAPDPAGLGDPVTSVAARVTPLPVWQQAGLAVMVALLTWDAVGGRRRRAPSTARVASSVARPSAKRSTAAPAAAALLAMLVLPTDALARQAAAMGGGLAALAAGRLDEAATVFERAAREAAVADIATFDLALVRARQKRFPDAIVAFTTVMTRASAPDVRHRAQFNRGIALVEAGRLRDALNDFADVLRRDPADDAARRNYAITRARLDANPPPAATPPPPQRGRSSPDLPSQNYKFTDGRTQRAPARARSDW